MNSEQNDTNLCLNIVRIFEERRECCYVGLCYKGLCEGVRSWVFQKVLSLI